MLNPRLPPWIENENYLNFSIYKDPPFATSPTPATATSCPVWLAGYIAGWCGRPKFLWGPMRAYPRKGALRKILDNSRCFKHVLTCFNHVLTCFNHECSGLYFQILLHVFWWPCAYLPCGSVMNWGHICVLYSMFLVGQGFFRRCCMTNQPHEHNFTW